MSSETPADPAQYVTANDLLTGAVVFLAEDGGWVEDLAAARLLADPQDAARRLAGAQADRGRVVDATLAAAAVVAGTIQPVHVRERVRATGPSNYVHGKQEHGRHV